MTCYDRKNTLIATGHNMAVADGYRLTDHNWSKIHPDFGARRIIESAYQEAIFLKDGNVELANQAAENIERFATSYGFI